jgi:hypothetical protein
LRLSKGAGLESTFTEVLTSCNLFIFPKQQEAMANEEQISAS